MGRLMRHAFKTLYKLMGRQRLTVEQVHRMQEDGPERVQKPAIRTMMREMAEEIDYVDHEGESPKTYFFSWPVENRTSRHAAAALQLARELTSFMRDSALGQALDETTGDVLARLAVDEPAPDDIARMFYAKTLAMNPQEIQPSTLDAIVRCLFEKRVFEAEYTHFKGSRHSVTIQPYSLIFGDEGLYLYGRCVDSGEKKYKGSDRIFQVLRLSEVAPGRVVGYPTKAKYDPTRDFQYCWGIFLPRTGEQVQRIVLSFSPVWRDHLVVRKHRWHPHQGEPSDRIDQWVDVPFDLFITQDLVRWVRSHGPSQLRVLRPERLRVWVETGIDPDSGTWG
jgi:predicted DNA-binding transcriptional regulator YafY